MSKLTISKAIGQLAGTVRKLYLITQDATTAIEKEFADNYLETLESMLVEQLVYYLPKSEQLVILRENELRYLFDELMRKNEEKDSIEVGLDI